MDKYKDAALPVSERVDDLLSRMTLDEKLAQITCVMAAMGFFVGDKEQIMRDGVGQISTLCGCFTKEMNAALVNDTQKFLLENTRLGIPAMFHVETLSGAQSAGATSYPIPIGLAATFNPALIEKMADGIREEMTALRMKLAFAPVMDVARDPRWGRTCETYGENATLASAMSVAYVKGLQGGDLREGVAATAKHFVGYAMGEAGMNIAGAHLGRREIREVYTKPFEAAIRLVNLECVMNAYHVIDNVPMAAGKEYLRGLLRGELGFDGLVVSDYASIDKLFDVYHIAEDYTQAGIMALKAGIDDETPNRLCYADGMKRAVESGDLDIAYIDEAVRRTLSLKMRLGLFENPFADIEKMNAIYQNKDALETALNLSRESIVLLKNEGALLPLDFGKLKKTSY
ncbi:MAG: glycoside hydrolase family 3 protein [Oscillospiraceae bacterium]|jgi:beta-glucosidase|nr:glycoside hydrolase family 3 protein [Oscillospiraceae bacterium]